MPGAITMKQSTIDAPNTNSLRTQLNAVLRGINPATLIDIKLEIANDAGTITYSAMVIWGEEAGFIPPLNPVTTFGINVVGSSDLTTFNNALNTQLSGQLPKNVVRFFFVYYFDGVDYNYLAVIIKKTEN